MDALAGENRRWSAVARVAVSRCGILPGILLLCLRLSGCAGGPPVVATPTSTASPTATATPAFVSTIFPAELIRTSWQLDAVEIDGQMQPPWNPEQCLAVGYRPESFYFYTGCNHGYCDSGRSSSSSGVEVVCSVTVQGCFTTPAPATGARRVVEWEPPFTDAMLERRSAEVRDGKLWLASADKRKPALVFRPMDGPCYGQEGYLRP